MLDAAKRLRDNGFSVIRVSTDGTKSPSVGPATDYKWRPYQEEIASEERLIEWFGDDHPAIGVVTGTVSGNLEMLEFEGRAIQEGIHARFFDAISVAGASDLLARIASGYLESSPSGGLHFFYRVEDDSVAGNTKLAQREAWDSELTTGEQAILDKGGKRATRTLIETRGEHGFVVVAPSHFAVYTDNDEWKVLNGCPESVATITATERDLIHACAISLNDVPLPEPIPDKYKHDPSMLEGDLHPGEDYNLRGSWNELLEPHGWKPIYQDAVRTHWTRPGKRLGRSAVTGGEQGDYFCSWSTSTEFEAFEQYSKWRVFALLNHAGDFGKAASALRTLGYGSPRRERKLEPPESSGSQSPGHWLAGTDGPEPGDSGSAAEPGAEVAKISPVVAGPATTGLYTDNGNAEQLVRRFGTVIRYCPEKGQWLSWQGKAWEWADGRNGGIVREYAKQIAATLPDNDKDAQRHRRYSQSAMGTTNMLTQASTAPGVAIRLENLDARPYELNTPNGIVDLRTATLLAHNPDNLHTRLAYCSPDFDADQSDWSKFLHETFRGHDEILPYIQRLAGYSASGVVGEHVLPFALGSGRNGKGVFLETVRKVLGEYGTVAPNNFLMVQQYAQHETEIASLAGARMVLCSEVNIDDRFDEAKVKLLTGGDTLKARFMRKDHFTFEPTHKLWLMGNDQPTVSNGGPAFWERLRIIPFKNHVAREDRIVDLQGILAREHGPAVMAWVVAGAYGYFRDGLNEPESVKFATGEYSSGQDTITLWMNQWCKITDVDVKINKTIARKSYEDFCRLEGATPVTPQKFGRVLKNDFKIDSYSSNGKAWYKGLIINNEESERIEARQGWLGEKDD